jgi:AcrR family transcriptional regulator
MSTHAHPRSGRSAPRWKRRKDERPGEILAAALEEFVERGYAATRLDDVAQRAGVTKGTMYLYFDSKEELLKAAVRQNVLPVIERGERLVEEHRGPSGELLREVVRAWWEFLHGTRVGGISKLMMAEARNFPDLARFYHDEVVKRGHALFARVLQRGIDSGEFRPVEVPVAVRLIVAPLIMSSIWKYSFSACEAVRVDLDRVIDLHLDLFLRGIAARPETHHA